MARGLQTPSQVMECVELVLDAHDNLFENNRLPGENNIAMVAWRMVLFTPEYPKGRELIIIANDITHKIGSFGPKEDILFLVRFQRVKTFGFLMAVFCRKHQSWRDQSASLESIWQLIRVLE